jgi:acetyl esterase/lipase
MMKRTLAIVTILSCLLSCTHSKRDVFIGAPDAPKGFDSYLEAEAAMDSGEVAKVQQPEEIPDTIRFYDDVYYATHDGVELSLDIFVPTDATTPRPLLLFIHGGGWRKGKKEDYLLYNVEFAKLGYVTASVEYRLAPAHHFPANVQDVKCAIGFLRSHAGEYKIDPDVVVTLGGSAGGHLALMAGYAQDPALECPDVSAQTDTSVQAVVNIYGVVDCTTPVAIQAYQVIDYIGAPYAEAQAHYEAASPIYHLDANDPPTLTFHGTIDELVPVAQADRLHAALDSLDVMNYYDRIEGWHHSMDLAQPVNERCRYIIARFLNIYAPLPE